MSIKDILLPKSLDGANSKFLSGTVAVIAGIFGAAFLAPFIFAALGGIFGFIAGVAAVWAAVKFAPTFGIMLGNQTLKLLKWDAAQNPVETLESEWASNEAKIKSTEATALEFSTEVEGYTPTVTQMERDYPEDAPPFRKHLDGMVETRDLIYVAISEAKAGQIDFRRHITRVNAIWAATKTGNKLSIMAGKLSKTEATDQIRRDAALNAVKDRVAGSFANLDHLRRSMKDAAAAKAAMKTGGGVTQVPALPNNPSPTLLQSVDGDKVYQPVNTSGRA